jgi:uncharacterized membrane protein
MTALDTVAPVAAPREDTSPAHRKRSLADATWSPVVRNRLTFLGVAVISLWMVVLLEISTAIYHHMYLSADYASYYQAWSLIGSGHLNPLDTIWLNHVPFVRNDLELIIWPLSLLHLVVPQGFVLLAVQDIAIAASSLIIYKWILEFLERSRVSPKVALGIAVGVLLVIVSNPGPYQTVLFDFHIEPISTVFIVAAGRSLWLGQRRRAWLWVALALICGSFAAVTLVGLGISAVLAGRATRRTGGLVVLAGIAWLGFITLIGANVGSGLEFYAYLAGRTSLPSGSGILLVAGGIVTHPQRVINQLVLRFPLIWTLIRPVGVIGLASAWGFGVPVVVLVTDALNSQYGFTWLAFQNYAVFPFILLGTVMVLVTLGRLLPWVWILAVVLGLALLGTSIDYAVTTAPNDIRWNVAQVGPAQATQLNRALAMTPASAEVVVTLGVMGRFSGRRSAFFFLPHRTIPIESPTVVFVFDPLNEHSTPGVQPQDDIAASDFVRNSLHARVLVNSNGITAYRWNPPPGTNRVTFPVTPKSG